MKNSTALKIARRVLAHYRRYPAAWCKAKGHRTGPMPKGTGRRWKRCRRCGRMVLRLAAGFYSALLKRTYSAEHFLAPLERETSPFFDAVEAE